jgi:hypothetical protein
MPKVSDLSPLMALSELQCLSLETLPSWDSSGKTTQVDSLAPIGYLQDLRHLALFGVRPKDRSLAPLELCHRLQSARFTKFPEFEVSRFYQLIGLSDAHVPLPVFEAG